MSIEFAKISVQPISTSLPPNVQNTKQTNQRNNTSLPETSIAGTDNVSDLSNVEAMNQQEHTLATLWAMICDKLRTLRNWLRFNCKEDTSHLEQAIDAIVEKGPNVLNNRNISKGVTKPSTLVSSSNHQSNKVAPSPVVATTKDVDELGSSMSNLYKSLQAFEKIQSKNATKKDLIGKATKQDLVGKATKQDLVGKATTQDLIEGFAPLHKQLDDIEVMLRAMLASFDEQDNTAPPAPHVVA